MSCRRLEMSCSITAVKQAMVVASIDVLFNSHESAKWCNQRNGHKDCDFAVNSIKQRSCLMKCFKEGHCHDIDNRERG
ncbi:hypothetical protein TSUD_184700 [Trifolium subterraneum]|uniref:Uncharacterized protein n=1 Tax=Trifolium subterraneum TaxID=3900 RepID=A0A2Z6PHA8_TRISU|nr:hypothetical protein TSUD_184700 [Trifolium subterraneum]